MYKALARIIVRQLLDEDRGVRPKDPALRAEAARTERPHISDKRLAKFEVMTAGEASRYLQMDAMRLYYHVERNTIPHRRVDNQLLFSRRDLIEWLATDVDEKAVHEQPAGASRLADTKLKLAIVPRAERAK